MKKRRYKAHFIQWESVPNIEHIIDALVKEGILPNYILSKNWISSINDIIQALKEELEKDSIRWENIKLSVYIKDRYPLQEDKEDRLYGLNFEYLSQDRDQKDILKSILSKIFSLERSIISILEDNLHLRRFMLPRRNNLLAWYPFLKDLIDIVDNMKNLNMHHSHSLRDRSLFEGKKWQKLIFNLMKLDLQSINEQLDVIIRDQDKTWGIIISLNKRDFLSAFLSRIDIFKDFVQKEDLIKQFEKRKTSKIQLAHKYLFYSIIFFSLIFLLNCVMFYCSALENLSLTFFNFLEKFFGQNIFLFTLELLFLFLGLYFLSIYKSFLRIIELYDSHILLIESDFFYKNDDMFQNYEDTGAVFEMRKENAQKIHSLPEKTFMLLNGKEKITNEMPMVKIIENFLEITKSIIKK